MDKMKEPKLTTKKTENPSKTKSAIFKKLENTHSTYKNEPTKLSNKKNLDSKENYKNVKESKQSQIKETNERKKQIKPTEWIGQKGNSNNEKEEKTTEKGKKSQEKSEKNQLKNILKKQSKESKSAPNLSVNTEKETNNKNKKSLKQDFLFDLDSEWKNRIRKMNKEKKPVNKKPKTKKAYYWVTSGQTTRGYMVTKPGTYQNKSANLQTAKNYVSSETDKKQLNHGYTKDEEQQKKRQTVEQTKPNNSLKNVPTFTQKPKTSETLTPKIQKPKGIVFVQSTENNTIITLTDLRGNTKYWASAGSCGFKKSRRSSTYAAHTVGEAVGKKAISLGFHVVKAKINGTRLGGKIQAVKALSFVGLKITNVQETTTFAHNGCRLPKQRRT